MGFFLCVCVTVLQVFNQLSLMQVGQSWQPDTYLCNSYDAVATASTLVQMLSYVQALLPEMHE